MNSAPKLSTDKASTGEFTIRFDSQKFVYASEDFLEMCGYTRDELLNMCYDSIVHPDDYQPLMDSIVEQIGKVKVLKGYHRCVKKDGSVFYVFCHGYIEKDKDNVEYMHCVFADVTYFEDLSQKFEQTENELVSTRKKVRFETNKNISILKNIPVEIYVVDKESHEILYRNDAPIINKQYCYKVIRDNDKVCENCLIKSVTRSNPLNEVVFNEKTQKYVDVTVSEIDWDEKRTAYLISQKEHCLSPGEKSLKIKEQLLEKRYSFIFSHSSDYIIDIDVNSWQFTATKIAEDCNLIFPMSGRYEELLNAFCNMVYSEDKENAYNQLSVKSLLTLLMGDKATFVNRYKLITDKGVIWCELSFFCVKLEDNPSIVISVYDITENVLREEQDIIEKKRINMAVEKVYDFVLAANVTQMSYQLLSLNSDIIPAFEPSGTIEHYLNWACKLIIPEDVDNFMNAHSRITEAKGEIKTEFRMLCTDGKFHWAASNTLHVDNEFDNDYLVITMVKLIDTQKEYEQYLINTTQAATSANKAKTDFLSHMSHEIRTPMNAIMGFTQLAQKTVISPYVKECLGKIDISAHQLMSIINDILDMSKLENSHVLLTEKQFNIKSFANNLSDDYIMQANTRGICFVTHTADVKNAVCIGDEEHLKQIIDNLLSNAFKFTPNCGKITFSVEQHLTENQKAFYCLKIKDNGAGMSKDFIPKMFDAFQQEYIPSLINSSGSGLGLSIVKNLVDLMNGHIRVESEKDKGTEISVEIEFALPDTKDEMPTDTDISTLVDLTGKRILVVEDSQLNYEILAAILSEKQIIVEHAVNGAIAVDMFNAKRERYYDLIFMDIMMPVMDGLEATKQIRSSAKKYANSIPIIALTANAFADDIAKSLAYGMNNHISKPLKISQLEDVLYTYIK